MTDEKRGGPPSRGGPGGGNREGRPGGGRRDDKRGGPRKGGFGKGPAKPERRETYESLQLLTRGEGFKIDKFVLAEKGTHKPVKVEYRLTRKGRSFVPVIAAIKDWGARHLAQANAVEMAAAE